jgi:hypothetical protein
MALVVLVGFGLRFYAANHLVIVQDEPIYMSAGARYASHMRDGRWNMLAWEERNLEHPSLFKILYGFMLLTQPRPKINFTVDVKRFSPIENNVGERWVMTGRFTSVVIGTLTVLVLALLNPIAGLFMAIQSIAVLYTSSVYLEALPLFGSILCAIFYLNWFKAMQGSEKNNPRIHGWLFLSAGALGATTASKYIYGVVGLAIAIHYLVFATKKRILIRTLGYMVGWGVFAIFAFFVFDPYLWPHPKERLLTSLNYNREYSQSDDVKEFNYPFWQVFNWLAGSISTTVPAFKQGMLLSLDLLISLLALGGLPLLWKKEPLYVIWLVLGLLVLFVWPTKWTQYTLIILVPYCLSAAESVSWMISWYQSQSKRLQGLPHG